MRQAVIILQSSYDGSVLPVLEQSQHAKRSELAKGSSASLRHKTTPALRRSVSVPSGAASRGLNELHHRYHGETVLLHFIRGPSSA